MHNKKINGQLIALLVVGICCSCIKNRINSPVFSTINYVSPEVGYSAYPIESAEPVNINMIGAQDFKLVNNTILVSSAIDTALLYSYDIETFSEIGHCLRKGRGPNEFLQPRSINAFSLRSDKHPTSVLALDSDGRKMLRFELEPSLEKNGIENYEVSQTPFPVKNIFEAKNGGLFCRYWNSHHSGLKRCFLFGDKRVEIPDIDVVNNLEISTWNTGYAFNLVNFVIDMDYTTGNTVEAGLYLNVINAYSTLDNQLRKSICIGDSVMDVFMMEKLDILSLEIMFGDVRAYPEFFACLYLPTNGIMVFDWNGNLVKSWRFSHSISAFDIDFESKYVYVMNSESEQLLRYKINK